ncbi:heavy metal translocating P-type ATPase [Kitasatospora sp. NPDC058201]|uniref:heavy metal translocating P-type ATPase n=1 Tax=unclassified Kitasatospora TaxID=2633591 RepID=UPI003649A0AB
MKAVVESPGSGETGPPPVSTDLVVGGMTCAACVSRVEKRLARIEGVTAGVNLATGRARVLHPAGVGVEELVAAVERAGYTAEQAPDGLSAAGPDQDESADRWRLLVTALLAVPVVVLSMVPSLQFDAWQWVCFALSVPVVSWGSAGFHRRAWQGLRHAAATMDTLVSLGVVASFGWSAYALVFGGAGEIGMRMPFSLTADGGGAAHVYLEAAVGVPLFVLAGRLLEGRVRRRTGSALRALAELGAKEVCVRDPETGEEQLLPIEQLLPGQEFVVRPGERVATDGVVVEGSSALDLSLLTGESVPVEVGPGDQVAGATVNVGGALVVRATAVGADTQLARITALVADAQAGKARAQRLADTVAGVFVPCVLTVAVCVLGFWLGAGADPQAAVTAAVAVLVVACPCALGLATPTALLAATGRGAELGVLVRGPEVLESLRRIDTVVLDKTGTLTTGRMELAAVAVAPDAGVDEDQVLRLAGAVEHRSEHPIGRAVVGAARERCGSEPLPAVAEFRATAGVGVAGTVEGRQVRVVRPDDAVGPLPAGLVTALEEAAAAGRTPVVVELDGRAVAVLAVGDTLRSGSWRALHRLRRMGLEPVLLTGDGPGAAHAVATELGIERVHFSASPERKAEVVAELKAAGRTTAVVGDGVNDAVALASADLGVALASGSDAAIGAAGLTLVRGDIEAVVDAVRLARRTLGTIRVNLLWAFGYNVVLIPLAAVGLLNPMLAAVAMSLSSLLVVGNSLRLRTWRPGRGASDGRGGGAPGGGRRPDRARRSARAGAGTGTGGAR